MLFKENRKFKNKLNILLEIYTLSKKLIIERSQPKYKHIETNAKICSNQTMKAREWHEWCLLFFNIIFDQVFLGNLDYFYR